MFNEDDEKNIVYKLISLFEGFPHLGKVSARRITLHLLKNKNSLLPELGKLLKDVYNNTYSCSQCFNIDISDPCGICLDKSRDHKVLCVLETISDLWVLEKNNIFRGVYHVLGGKLSAESNIMPGDLTLDSLLERVKKNEYQEIIIATNSTFSSQSTAEYVVKILSDLKVAKITLLANGIPIGGELDYLDSGTINSAFRERKVI